MADITNEEREKKIEASAKLIGKAVFNSILITLVSFAPILFLISTGTKIIATKAEPIMAKVFVKTNGEKSFCS